MSDEKHEYIEQQLSEIQSDFSIPGGWGALIAGIVGYKSILAEFEFGLHGEEADYYGGSHEGWLRISTSIYGRGGGGADRCNFQG
ncbi:MAG: hypothetical protein GTO51_09720 [Candidatus Latescibacteria bacterium]|nr:hypothetical protein [Candidatus Latescibacterota bacterium]NIM66246.1 hypothetical protein [Candidatus Latescibacterota bacterium]NIO02323.1 hypothetical protein [Candidatus Latescibacterota bacterium]NIO29854.1 hypothetical protein [Candidatus Latescibacterota bacterium]NIO57466.1 hypothetical protein [Candidatus Latescibacterota bacterium]